MADNKDCFIREMDFIDGGIMDRLKRFNNMLKITDYVIWQNLEDLKIMTHFYAFKWIMLMLT